ncbi:MAG TPA: serine hydrolase [Fluviicola sp.]|nr:serine hydrolase [Fluviicola sp.]
MSCLKGNAQTYFPPLIGSTWETIAPASLGWCDDSIQKMYNWLGSTDTKAFIVLKNGKIVLEKYFGTFTADSLHVWNSAGKTLTAYCVGIAQKEGLLDIDDKTSDYIGTGWTSEPLAKENLITIKHQLSMTSGLDDGVSDIFCTDPSCLVYLTDAGNRWAYHNGPYTMLDSVIKVATGLTLNQWTYQKISSKIGMSGLFIQIGYNHIFVSNPRSMARFGLLLSQNGFWNGTPILNDPTFLAEMTNSSQLLNPSYGYLTWLNGKSSFMIPQSQFVFNGSLCPNAPADMFAAEGKNAQIINVCPSDSLVLIRMGATMGNSLVGTQYNDTIWQYMNRLSCHLTLGHLSQDPWNVIQDAFQGTVQIHGFKPSDKFRVYNELGQPIDVQMNNGILTIDSWSSGVYFLVVSNQRLQKSFKILR